MKTIRALASAATLLALLPLAGLADEKGSPKPTGGSVHEITLPAMQPDLPAGPGKETVAATCVICHSTRYITMQPAFTRAVWTAEVEKMRKTFGAPLTNDQAAQAVEYLVAIRGKP